VPFEECLTPTNKVVSGQAVSPFDVGEKDQAPKAETKDHDATTAKDQKVGPEERKTNLSENKNKLVGKRTYEEICRSYENMFAFDWELRDINNLRHPPGKCPLSIKTTLVSSLN